MSTARSSISHVGANKRLVVCCLAMLLSANSLVHAADGPSPYPREAADWPGAGVIRVFGWMTDNRRAFWRRRDQERGSIVFAGDSLIASWKDLKHAFPGERVANRGIGGDVSRGLLFRFQEDVLDLDPRAIVILIGTNDLTARQDADLTLANIRTMLDMTRAHDASLPVLLCTVPPSADPKAPVSDRERESLNEGLRALSQEFDRVALVDVSSAFSDADGEPDPKFFRADLLHFSPQGHARLKELVAAALRETGRTT
jgi:Lysophospholipase L1 and related esterases